MTPVAKDAERLLNVLESLNKEVKASLEAAVAKAEDKFSEALQQRRMRLKDLEDVHKACYDLLTENARMQLENVNFVEQMRGSILMPDDTMPKELFTEQVEMFTPMFKKMIDRYEATKADYINVQK